MLLRSSTPHKDKKAYEKAVAKYEAAYWAHDDNKTDSTRQAWQESMVVLLEAYNHAFGMWGSAQTIALDWMALKHLMSAMRTVIEGKDTDLFYVTPSDRYNSKMRRAKQIAVDYVAAGKTPESRQEKKRWIMKEYGISRSLLNEWIRTTEPDIDYNYEEFSGYLFNLSDYYKKNKLVGRKRKP